MIDHSTTDTYPPLPLPAAMREEIVAHAQAEAPRECCGVIAGQDGTPTRLYRMTNAEPGVDRYRVDDAELFRVYRELSGHGWDLVAIYHSHPVSPAYPSRTDIDLAAWPDAVYVICSLADPAAPVLRAFRIVNERITEIGIETAPDGAAAGSPNAAAS